MENFNLKKYLAENKLNEANPDSTISPDEGDREDMLMTNVESSIDDLLSMAKKEAYNI